MRFKVLVILGATATGKSSLGVELAKLISGEIISGDSVLVYRGLNIGSAKPNIHELTSVKHHMVNILNPIDNFDVIAFKNMVEQHIKEINLRGNIPILVGGTGLYIKAVLENYDFSPVSEDVELRQRLDLFAEEHGNIALHKKLQKLDLSAALRLHPNDRFRVIRAIEVSIHGKINSKTSTNTIRNDFEALVYGLDMPRSELYCRINKRVDKMLELGLVDEVRTLLQTGVPIEAKSMKAIGYKQVVEYLNGNIDYCTCVDKIKQCTRNFAKRQNTLFKGMNYINWLSVNNNTDLITLAKKISMEAFQ